jgi:hypothetical protein
MPMMARTFELRRESNRLPLTDIRLEVYGKMISQCRLATIASARTIGGVHDVDRYSGDRVADDPHGPI